MKAFWFCSVKSTDQSSTPRAISSGSQPCTTIDPGNLLANGSFAYPTHNTHTHKNKTNFLKSGYLDEMYPFPNDLRGKCMVFIILQDNSVKERIT